MIEAAGLVGDLQSIVGDVQGSYSLVGDSDANAKGIYYCRSGFWGFLLPGVYIIVGKYIYGMCWPFGGSVACGRLSFLPPGVCITGDICTYMACILALCAVLAGGCL